MSMMPELGVIVALDPSQKSGFSPDNTHLRCFMTTSVLPTTTRHSLTPEVASSERRKLQI